MFVGTALAKALRNLQQGVIADAGTNADTESGRGQD